LLSSSNIYSRFSKQGLARSDRDIMQYAVLNIWKSEDKWGIGANTYPLIQHKYKAPELGNTDMSRRAHNDCLEFFITSVVNRSILFLAFVVTSIMGAFKKNVVVLKYKNVKFIRQSLILSLGYLAVYCALDFNLAKPAIFLSMTICLAGLVNFSNPKPVARCLNKLPQVPR
jgi:hypothetical protein